LIDKKGGTDLYFLFFLLSLSFGLPGPRNSIRHPPFLTISSINSAQPVNCYRCALFYLQIFKDKIVTSGYVGTIKLEPSGTGFFTTIIPY